MMTTVEDLHRNVLALMERCAPSRGVFDVDAWEAAGCPPVAGFAEGMLPRAQRDPRTMTLEEHVATGDWAFASTPGGVESLEASHSAAEALYAYGDLARLPAQALRDWVAYFNQYQDPDTGYYLGPYVRERRHPSWTDAAHVTHPWAHMHDHLIVCLVGTLRVLGGQPRYRLSEGSMTGRFLDRAYLRHYLHGRYWRNYRGDLNFRDHHPWYLGNEYWFPGSILWLIADMEAGTPAGDQALTLLHEEWYGWHDANLSPWGFWYGDLDGDPERLYHEELDGAPIPTAGLPRTAREWAWHGNQVMGGAHQMWVYDHDGHPIDPAVRRNQTDLLLAMQNRNDGHWGTGDPTAPSSNSNDCTDVDCMTLLAYNFIRQDYRRDDIQAALDRGASVILRDKVAAEGVLQAKAYTSWSHHHASYETLSPGDAGNLHQQAFYLWPLVCAATVLERSDNPAVQSFIDHPWPLSPTNWLWCPPRLHEKGRETSAVSVAASTPAE